MRRCAIDPGLKGGIAFDEAGVITLHKMPTVDMKLIIMLRDFDPDDTIIEKTSGFIGEKHPGSYMFTFGWVSAAPYFILRTLNKPIRFVTPAMWQHRLGVPERSDFLWVTPNRKKAYREFNHKRKLKMIAKELYPLLRVTLYTADALLILHAANTGKI